jgi:DNA-binding HxlR family transcriptional regulator
MTKNDGSGLGARSACPIATTLDLMGDKWTLILIRDMLTGKSRYGEFLGSPEGIPTNILANRLKRMEAIGLIAKHPYQSRPPRFAYRLTAMGRGLLPLLHEICIWANANFQNTWTPPREFMELRP